MKFVDHDDAKDPIPAPCPDMRDRERTAWTGEPEQTDAGFVRDVMLYGAVLGLCWWGPVGMMMAGALVGGRRR